MANDVNIKFAVDGEKQFKSAISAIKSEVKEADSALKLASEQMKGMTDEEEKARVKTEALQKVYDANKKALETLAAQQEKAKAAMADLADAMEKAMEAGDAEAVARLQTEYDKAAKSVSDLGTQMNNASTKMESAKNSMEGLEDATEDTEDALEDAGEAGLSFGEILQSQVVADFIVDGVKKLASGLKDLAFSAFQTADDLATEATVTGISTDALQEFYYMAGLTDTEVSTITGSLKKLTTNMNSAREGTGAAADAFSQLGIDVTDSDGSLRDSTDVFNEIIDALGNMESGTERDAIAMQLFGKSAQELNPLIEAGSDTIKAYAQEAHDVGYVMDEDVINKNLEASDAYERMTQTIEATKLQIGSELAPVLADIFGKIQNVTLKVQENKESIEKLIPFVAGITAGFIAYKGAMLAMTIIDTVRKATEGMTVAQAALNAIMNANPVMIVVTALAALVTALVVAYKTNDEFKAKVDAAFSVLKNGVTNAINGIKTAVESLKELPAKALSWGKDLIANFINGIKQKLNDLKNNLKTVAGTVKSYLGFSEPEKGPLSDFHTYAPDMIDLFTKGMRENAYKIQEASAEAAGSVNLTGSLDNLAASIAGQTTRQTIQLVCDRKVLAEVVNSYNSFKGRQTV